MKLSFFDPPRLIWLLVHGLICLMGVLILELPAASVWLGTEITVGLGTAFFATGVVGFAIFFYMVTSEGLRQQISVIHDSGIENVFDARATRIKAEYDQRIRTASEMDILGFGLSSLREDYLRDFSAWSQRCRVRIILLDPAFPSMKYSYAIQRDEEEGNPQGQIRNDVEAFINGLRALPQLNYDNFKVRHMHALPSVNIFRIDNELFWGPYLIRQQSRNSPTFLVKRGGHLYQTFLRHFEALWTDEILTTMVDLQRR